MRRAELALLTRAGGVGCAALQARAARIRAIARDDDQPVAFAGPADSEDLGE